MTGLPWPQCEVLEATDSEAWIWDVGDEALYDLCARTPDHTDVRSVVAKLWLIGRSYAAPLERTGDTGEAADLYEAAAGALINSDLDRSLRRLQKGAVFSKETLRGSIRIHAEVVSALRSVVGKNLVSLASKYLHFHQRDSFFIYDSRVEAALRAVYRNQRTPDAVRKEGIPEYAIVAYRANRLQKEILDRYHLALTPREVDRLLWLKDPAAQ